MTPAAIFLVAVLSTCAVYAPTCIAGFTCKSPRPPTCQSLAGFSPANSTTYAAVAALFKVRSFRALLGANDLPLLTPPSNVIPAGSTVRVPLTCACSGSAGFPAAGRRPSYTVRPGDGLDSIARSAFGGLVSYKDIAAANNVTDPDKVAVGEVLWIPVPCSCDPVAGERVVHYAHVAAAGSSVEGIAAMFGTTAETLLDLNGIADPRSLMAGQVLDVPLRACSSSISNSSMDRNMRIVNGSYIITAQSCVRCSCSSATWQLECHPTQGISKTVCPATSCGGLSLGNSTPASPCELTTCAYAGYTSSKNDFTILRNLTTRSSCNNGSAPSTQPSSNASPSVAMSGLNWIEAVFILHILVTFSGFKWL